MANYNRNKMCITSQMRDYETRVGTSGSSAECRVVSLSRIRSAIQTRCRSREAAGQNAEIVTSY